MLNVLKYKDFIGSVEVSLSDNCLYGKILHINGLVTYEASTVKELKLEFEAAVDDYIEFCHEQNLPIHKYFDGRFNVRAPLKLHKKSSIPANQPGMTLDSLVNQALKNKQTISEREVSTDYQYVKNRILGTLEFTESSKGYQINYKIMETKVQYQNLNVMLN